MKSLSESLDRWGMPVTSDSEQLLGESGVDGVAALTTMDQWGIPLAEGLSDILYHKTGRAAEILTSNEFRLTFANSSDASFKSGEGWFYLSTARSPLGAYSEKQTLVLDGSKLNQRYSGGPVDYWGPEYRKGSGGQSNEMEDRVWSRERIIPNAKSYIKEVHVLLPEKGTNRSTGYVRTIALECKKAGIPVFFYEDKKAYKILNAAKAISPDFSRFGDNPPEEFERSSGVRGRVFSQYRRTDGRYVDGLIQLYWMKNPADLAKHASDPSLGKAYRAYRNIRGMDRGSGVLADIHNLKRESEMSSLAEVMRDGGFKSTKELFDFIYKKFEKVGI